jgi:alpha-tubulin suppressor-like RCC1 family protein
MRDVIVLLLSVAGLIALPACAADQPTEPPTESADPASLAISSSAVLAFRQVSAGTHGSCGVTIDYRAYCWGYGWLGDGTEGHFVLRPVAVVGGLQFVQVSVGVNHTCGVTRDRRAYCWGLNIEGGLGNVSEEPRTSPEPVAGGLRFRGVSAGGQYTCGVTTTDAAYCWGSNSSGQVGDGTRTTRFTPTLVTGGLSFRQVTAGGAHSCGATTDNRAYCWGGNLEGELGNGRHGARNGSLTPSLVLGTHRFRRVFAGGEQSCGLTGGDRAYCWGSNTYGGLGNGTIGGWSTRPVAVVGGLQFSQLSPGFGYTCATTLAQQGYCWGRNAWGSLGDGTTTQRAQPTAVAGGLQFRMFSTGAEGNHSCGVTTGDRAYCWGLNDSGQLGDGTQTRRLRPRAVVGPL